VEVSVSLDDYHYLWDGSESGWVLLATGRAYLPYNQETERALIIEDDDEFLQVIDKMKELAIPVLDTPESTS
jgi:hypothetical protein